MDIVYVDGKYVSVGCMQPLLTVGPAEYEKIASIYLLLDYGVPRYVGKSIHPVRRFRDHIKYRQWPTEMRILNSIPESQYVIYEQFWISFFRDSGFELENKNDGGDGPLAGYKDSLEVRKRKSLAQRRRVRTPEEGRAISRGKLGHRQTPETKMKISITKTGVSLGKRSEEWCRNISLGKQRAKAIRDLTKN